MKKKISYEGNIYDSMGALIKHLIDDEKRTIEVWIIPGKRSSNKVLEFRVSDKKQNTFVRVTEYQAKKYLSDSQKENISLFKEVKHDLNEDNFRNFGAFLDKHNENKKRYLEDVRFQTMFDDLKKYPYKSTEL